MSFHIATGSILDLHTKAFVNTVNCVGVAGAGVALATRNRYPNWFKVYKSACSRNEYSPGKCIVHPPHDTKCNSYIIDFCTKLDWRHPSKLEWISRGLDSLSEILSVYQFESIAIPPLGCGNGGLDYKVVRPMIVNKLQHVDTKIYLW